MWDISVRLVVENARSCTWADLSPRYYFSDSGLSMSHFDSCQLTLIWFAHITLNYCQPTDGPVRRSFVFIFELVSVTYYISLYVGAKRLVFSSEPARWSCDNCRRMSDFGRSQSNHTDHTIRMAYINEKLIKLCKIYCDIWHLSTWIVCTGGRTLRHNQIFSGG